MLEAELSIDWQVRWCFILYLAHAFSLAFLTRKLRVVLYPSSRSVFLFVLLSYSSYCFKHRGHCLIELSFVYWANSKRCLESYRLKVVATGSHTGLRLGSYNKDEMFWHSFVPGQLPPFSMPSKLLISHGEANMFVCFTIGYIPDSKFNYL